MEGAGSGGPPLNAVGDKVLGRDGECLLTMHANLSCNMLLLAVLILRKLLSVLPCLKEVTSSGRANMADAIYLWPERSEPETRF